MKTKPPLLALLAVTSSLATVHAATFKVTKTGDDGSEGTLRWAIERNNQNSGGHVIEIQAPEAAREPFVIRLKSLLPPIKGPAKVIGLNRKSTTLAAPDATDVVLDGSSFINGDDVNSCPGTVSGFGPNVRSVYGPGLSVVDSGNVEISGLEIRNFCIGLLGMRSHDNHFHHNKIHNTSGAAGIAFTGDDGTPAGGATTGLSTRNLFEYNIIFDNGDGAEFTRGTSDSTAQFNVFYETHSHGNVPYSEGIELAGQGNSRNRILNNRFTGYGEALQLGGNSELLIEGNTITASSNGITAGGSKVVIRNNLLAGNRMGIGSSAKGKVTITQNRIYNNGKPVAKATNPGLAPPPPPGASPPPPGAPGGANASRPGLLGIDVGVNDRSMNDLDANCGDAMPDCDEIQNFPTLNPVSTWIAGGRLNLKATLASRPNASFVIEFYASHGANGAGNFEGEMYLGGVTVQTNAKGSAEFEWPAYVPDPFADGSARIYVTATATNAAGATSEFSDALELAKGLKASAK